jgi:hypothetical protein
MYSQLIGKLHEKFSFKKVAVYTHQNEMKTEKWVKSAVSPHAFPF